jgi:hypothetical protein
MFVLARLHFTGCVPVKISSVFCSVLRAARVAHRNKGPGLKPTFISDAYPKNNGNSKNVPQRLKPFIFACFYDTAEAASLSKA